VKDLLGIDFYLGALIVESIRRLSSVFDIKRLVVSIALTCYNFVVYMCIVN
jgi:hypothetical protein